MNAIITGATKGIGRAIAEKMASNGINLAVCSRNKNDLETMTRQIEGKYDGVKVYARPTDLSSKSETEAFADFCLDTFDSVNILVNNAGIFIPGTLLDENDGALEKMIEINLYSPYYLTRKIAPQMVSNNSGYIINVSSIAGLKAYPNGGSYGITKSALRCFSMQLREELKDSGVKVTTILPGATWSHSWAGVDLPEERLMQASDIAEAVWSIFEMSPSAVMEEIILRPQLGDL